MTAQDFITQLQLEPLPGEGGYYKRVYLDNHVVQTQSLGSFNASELPLMSVIYYLMTEHSFSALHWLSGVEVWTWITGDPVEQIILHPSAMIEKRILGIGDGEQPVSVVPGDCWQGSRLKRVARGYALCSTVMAPAYSQTEFKLADQSVANAYTHQREYVAGFITGEQ